MAEHLRVSPSGSRIGSWPPLPIGRLGLWRGSAALAVATGMLALLLLVFEAELLSPLPHYPAAALALFVIVILPGLFLQQALLGAARAGAVERLVIALPLGIAIAAPSGLAALWLELDLQTFMRMHAALAAATAGAATLFFQREDAQPAENRRAWRPEALPLALLLAVVVAGVLISPVWLGDSLARDFDDWTYATYVNSYVHADGLTPLEPVGIGEAPYPRIATNVWLVLQAAVARAADTTPDATLLTYLPPLLLVFALGASYALSKRLFDNVAVGLLSVAFLLGYAILDLSPDEGFGRNLLIRTSEDKMVATFVLLPAGLLLTAAYLSRPSFRLFAAFVLLSVAIFVTHVQPLLFLAIALPTLAAFRAALARTTQPLRELAPLVLPLALLMAGQFLFWTFFHRSNELWPGSQVEGPIYHESFKLLHVPGGLFIGNYHLLLHPLVLGALVLAPLLWLRARGSIGNQLLLVAMLGWLPWFFFPPLSVLLAKFASKSLLWRLPYMMPASIALAYFAHEGIQALLRRIEGRRPSGLPAARRAIALAAPVAVVAATLGAALLVQETYVQADGSTFYKWTSPASILPWTDRSIFLGGKDRLLSGEWRVTGEEAQLFRYVRTQTEAGSVILVPERIGILMPGLLWEQKPVHSRALPGLGSPPDLVVRFYNGQLRGEELAQSLREHSVDYIVVKEVTGANASLRELPSAQPLAEIGQYVIYDVRR